MRLGRCLYDGYSQNNLDTDSLLAFGLHVFPQQCDPPHAVYRCRHHGLNSIHSDPLHADIPDRAICREYKSCLLELGMIMNFKMSHKVFDMLKLIELFL